MMTAARLRLLAELLDEWCSTQNAEWAYAKRAATLAGMIRVEAVVVAGEEADPDSFQGAPA